MGVSASSPEVPTPRLTTTVPCFDCRAFCTKYAASRSTASSLVQSRSYCTNATAESLGCPKCSDDARDAPDSRWSKCECRVSKRRKQRLRSLPPRVQRSAFAPSSYQAGHLSRSHRSMLTVSIALPMIGKLRVSRQVLLHRKLNQLFTNLVQARGSCGVLPMPCIPHSERGRPQAPSGQPHCSQTRRNGESQQRDSERSPVARDGFVAPTARVHPQATCCAGIEGRLSWQQSEIARHRSLLPAPTSEACRSRRRPLQPARRSLRA